VAFKSYTLRFYSRPYSLVHVTMAHQQLGFNDAVLLSSLIYACIDLHIEWESFSACSKPIHKWLLVSYICVVGFRLTHWAGSRALQLADRALSNRLDNRRAAAAGELLLNLRHKDALPRIVASLTWAVGLPFFSLWTLLGTSWMYDVLNTTPECVPTATHLYFSLFWIVLCYAWIIIHAALGTVAFILERRVRRAEGSLREIEDDDVRQRWGSVSSLNGYQELVGAAPSQGDGLLPADIKCLPCDVASTTGEALVGKECSICLNEFEPGDPYRTLPGCSHSFHRSCIDLWLLRQANCPLCKTTVSPSP